MLQNDIPAKDLNLKGTNKNPLQKSLLKKRLTQITRLEVCMEGTDCTSCFGVAFFGSGTEMSVLQNAPLYFLSAEPCIKRKLRIKE